MSKFDRFVDKAEKILAEAPPFANDKDKIAMLNRQFRLNREDSKIFLTELKKIKSKS